MSNQAVLEWQKELLFRGEMNGRELVLDGRGQEGLSPMEALMFALAGCMAIDLVHILGRMRAELHALKAEIQGERAQAEPKRFTRIQLHYIISGNNIKPSEVERAIALSREKYCSVYHSLRADLELQTTYEIQQIPPAG
jgi:putative redox protein